MKLTVLTDNCAGAGFVAEHGLSYLIEHKGMKILLDTGHTDVFLQNAKRLGIDILKEIETVVLSHGHWDHGDGLKYLTGKTLITHPSAFIKRYRKNDHSHIGLTLSKDELKEKFTLKITKEPFKISQGIIFLGEIPRENNFEAKSTSFVDENNKPDFVPDDSALAIIDKGELIIITGCSHAGICNIITYAQKVTGIQKVNTIIGGLHLKHKNKQTYNTIHFLKELNIQQVYPSHCTELEALAVFVQEFKIKQVKTGQIIEI